VIPACPGGRCVIPSTRNPNCWAEMPNEVWSWEITKLMGPAKWSYFYLYVILDIFGRRLVERIRSIPP
jgi:putative transposase